VTEDEKVFNNILKYLRKNVPNKSALIKKEKVTYITGSKLVDALMSSQWGPTASSNDDTVIVDTRTAAVKYCKKLIDGKYLCGGKKIEMKVDKNDEEIESSESSKKKVRRFRIEWCPHVREIIDSPDEIYIWTYEVPQRYTFLIGLVLLAGVIGFTLQPLWPDSSKMGMWFLSVIMMALLGILIVLYIVRWLLWALIYTFTNGGVIFWLFPNLDDDKLGVIDSFKPFYSLKYKKKKKKQIKDEAAVIHYAEDEEDINVKEQNTTKKDN
jgi:hypothetical protein